MNFLKRAALAVTTMAAVMGLGEASMLSAEPPQKVKAKTHTGASAGQKTKTVEALPKQTPKGDSGLKHEAPNTVSKKDQASGSSEDASAKGQKRKVEELFDKPNPMESKVKTNAGKSLGVETGTKGSGVNPVDPRKTAAPKTAGKAPLAKPMNTQEKMKQGMKK